MLIMNWGNKLIIVFLLFAVLMSTLVYKSVTTKYDLVSKDYYKDELRYQDKIDGMANAAKVSDIGIAQDKEAVILALPKELKGERLQGEVWFYCATDDRKDQRFPLAVDTTGKQIFLKSSLSKTNYKVKLNWKTAGNTLYYAEKEVTVQ